VRESVSPSSGRIEHIDIAKGLSITLVALNHSQLGLMVPALMDTLSVFRLPLFFFVSGVFFSHAAPLKPFVAKRAGALLKPYATTMLGVLLIMLLLTGNYKLRLLARVYANGTMLEWPWTPVWFLPHLFAVHLFCYTVFRCTPYRSMGRVGRSLAILLMLLAGVAVIGFFADPLRFVLSGRQIVVWGLPCSADLLPLSAAYFLAGAHLSTRAKSVRFRPQPLALPLGALVAVTMLFHVRIDLNYRVLQNPLPALIGSACGIYAVLALSKLIERAPRIKRALSALGSASLFILIFHAFVEFALHDLINLEAANQAVRLAANVVIFLLCITLPMALKWLGQRSELLSLLMLPRHQRRFSVQASKSYA